MGDLLQVVDFALTKKWPQKWWCRRPPQPKAPENLSTPGPDKYAYFDPVATYLMKDALDENAQYEDCHRLMQFYGSSTEYLTWAAVAGKGMLRLLLLAKRVPSVLPRQQRAPSPQMMLKQRRCRVLKTQPACQSAGALASHCPSQSLHLTTRYCRAPDPLTALLANANMSAPGAAP